MSSLTKISSNFGNGFKKMLLCFIFLCFFLALVQEIHPYRTVKDLRGYFIPKVYSPVTLESWFNGDYQQTTESFLNEDFGFRNFLVRLDNQLRFWFFRKTRMEAAVIGKNDYLYEYGYILAYNGKDFMGEKVLNDTVAKIKFLQDTLKSMGKQLLVVLAPSKVRVYPEYISDSLNLNPNHFTNYMFLKKYFDKAGINYIDFNPIFEAKKSKSPYLLFPQLGVHWSRLEAVRAADTIIRRLASLSGSNLPEIKITSIEEKNELQHPDDDMVSGMNLLYYPKYKKMAYPEFEIKKENKELKNLIMVADSYWWDIFLQMIPKQVFSSNEFWYYNKEVWGSNFFGKLKADSVDTKRRILQNDYIVIMATESNYSRLGSGFVGQAISNLRRPIYPTKEELEDIKTIIKNNEAWEKDVIKKADARKISVEEMMSLDANWYFQHHGPVIKGLTLADIKGLIYTNEKWLSEVTKKAKERKISIDSMATEDAVWYLKKEEREASAKKIKFSTIEEVKESIRHNFEWMGQIRDKAAKNGVSIDSMINSDARWYLEQQKK